MVLDYFVLLLSRRTIKW